MFFRNNGLPNLWARIQGDLTGFSANFPNRGERLSAREQEPLIVGLVHDLSLERSGRPGQFDGQVSPGALVLRGRRCLSRL